LTSSTKSQSCGCPNMMTLLGDKVTAMDLSEVVLLKTENNSKNSHTLTRNDLEYQENRRKRKVRKLNFEVR
jgi:hypothetical protein